ncbi:MAG: aldo/keto reductase [Alphaproteobacteria bacterium]
MVFPTRHVGKTPLQVPVLGFGTAPLGGMFKAVDGPEGMRALDEALACGMTYVDTAPFYGFGLSERRVGDAIRGKPYQLSTKVGRLLVPGSTALAASMGWPDPLPFSPEFNYGYDAIMRSFEDSLQRLGLDRIDMLLAHDIGEMTHGEQHKQHFRDLADSGYRALEELRSSGQVKAIGLGVNEAQVCRDALGVGDWDVFLLAGRYTLLEQDPLDHLIPECDQRDVSLIIGGPFNSGVLVGGDTWNYAAAPEHVRSRVQQLAEVCTSFDVPLAAAALQFPLAHRVVTSVIPGLRTREELQATLNWARQDIPEDLWAALKQRGLLHPEAPTPTASPYVSSPT